MFFGELENDKIKNYRKEKICFYRNEILPEGGGGQIGYSQFDVLAPLVNVLNLSAYEKRAKISDDWLNKNRNFSLYEHVKSMILNIETFNKILVDVSTRKIGDKMRWESDYIIWFYNNLDLGKKLNKKKEEFSPIEMLLYETDIRSEIIDRIKQSLDRGVENIEKLIKPQESQETSEEENSTSDKAGEIPKGKHKKQEESKGDIEEQESKERIDKLTDYKTNLNSLKGRFEDKSEELDVLYREFLNLETIKHDDITTDMVRLHLNLLIALKLMAENRISKIEQNKSFKSALDDFLTKYKPSNFPVKKGAISSSFSRYLEKVSLSDTESNIVTSIRGAIRKKEEYDEFGFASLKTGIKDMSHA